MKSKTYSTSSDEIANLESRQNLIKQYQYMIHVINNDIVNYIKLGIYPRLKVDISKDYELSSDNKTLTIKEDNEQPTVKK